MPLHDDLLEQAKHLALRESLRPRQASLRRAISAAYYALFHLLVSEGAQTLGPPQPQALRARIGRAYVHGTMKKVCKEFAVGRAAASTKSILMGSIQKELVDIADTFVALQEERHTADYDVTKKFLRVDVLQKINEVQQAFLDWKNVRQEPNANVFLAALLLQDTWNK